MLEISRKKPRLANRLDPAIEQAVVKMAIDCPVANVLKSKGMIRSIWLHHDLNNLKKRLNALAAKMAQDGLVLTERQIQALEKQQGNKEAYGELDTAYPRYLVCQDTYYVGNLKGLGKVYGRRYETIPREEGLLRVQTCSTVVSGAMGPIVSILTNRGIEYKGKVSNHAYALLLSVEGITHTSTKGYSPQCKGMCEGLNKTMQEEIFATAMGRFTRDCQS